MIKTSVFHDKEIEVWNESERVHIGGGVYKDGEPEFAYAILVDLQPYSSAEAKRDYGFDTITTHTMFTDDDTMSIGSSIIKRGLNSFKIKEKISWDSFTQYILEML